jgi:hypothetical protein
MKSHFIKIFLIAVLLVSTATQVWSQKTTFIGGFSNFRFTTEHQYGAGVQLWQVGDDILGTFGYSEGLAGDTPTGLLENIFFDKVTRKISFSAKLTTGIHGCSDHDNIYSRNLFTFTGILKKSSITGVLNQFDALHPGSKPKILKITLKKEKNEGLFEYKNREEWESQTREMLKLRGPKW